MGFSVLFRGLIASFLAIFLCMGTAQAATVGFDLSISGSGDQPRFSLTNTGTTGRITSFALTIGDLGYRFDRVFTSSLVAPTGGTIALTFGDTQNGGLTTTSLGFAFTSFDIGDSIAFRTELDRLIGNQPADFRTVFRNNGLLPNSLLTVGFDNGTSLITVMPDGSVFDSAIVVRQTFTVATVPLPPSLLMLGAGLLGLFGMSRRSRARRPLAAGTA